VRRRLIALLLVTGIIIPASSALGARPHETTDGSGSIGIRLVGESVSSRSNPLGRLYIVDRLAPGTRLQRRVEISNSTGSTGDVAVYAAAAGFHKGRFGFAPGRSRNELAGWTSVSRRILHLPPDSKAFDTVTIRVPKHASSGERYAVIWAEVSAPASTVGGVTLVNRVGVRMYVSVSAGGALRSNFVIGRLTAKRSATGQPLVVARVRNTGRRTLEISGSMTLSRGPGGIRTGPLTAKLAAPLAPGHSKLVMVRLDRRLPRGPWRAHLRLRTRLIERAAVATITFPRRAAAAKPPIAKVGSGGSRRMILIGILLALLAVAALTLIHLGRWSRRRRAFARDAGQGSAARIASSRLSGS